jgi:hypothetical protein
MRYSSKGVLRCPSIVRTKGCGPPLKNDGWEKRAMGERVWFFTSARCTIRHYICCVTVQDQLDNIRTILVELPARLRQSPCARGRIALSSVGTTCPLRKIHCIRGLAKRPGLQPNWLLRSLSEEGWVGPVTPTSLIPLLGEWSEGSCWGS